MRKAERLRDRAQQMETIVGKERVYTQSGRGETMLFASFQHTHVTLMFFLQTTSMSAARRDQIVPSFVFCFFFVFFFFLQQKTLNTSAFMMSWHMRRIFSNSASCCSRLNGCHAPSTQRPNSLQTECVLYLGSTVNTGTHIQDPPNLRIGFQI